MSERLPRLTDGAAVSRRHCSARLSACLLAVTLCASSQVFAHAGPPYPIVSSRISGPYAISIWTDPDATDDGSAGGQFWIIVERADKQGTPPPDTTARVSVRSLTRRGAESTITAVPVRGDVTNQFAALVLNHEGPFAVHVGIDGALGPATAEGRADATYDLRPASYLIGLYVLPFLLVGWLWTRLLLKRRAAATDRAR